MRKKLIRFIVTFILVELGFYWVYNWMFGSDESDELTLENTPLKVEQIRSILELNTIRFNDEVVVDTLEYYKTPGEVVEGTIEKLFDLDQIKNSFNSDGIKRRLTMIVKGELLYGIDLKRKDFQVNSTKDTVFLNLPQPELLSISVNPKDSELYIENGKWQDNARTTLMKKARNRMIQTGEALRLAEKVKSPLEKIILTLVKTNKKVIINYTK